MWPPWLSSPRRATTATTPRNPICRTRTFSCSSFKDIHTLLADSDSEPGSESESESARRTPRSPSIFHRVRISTSVLRAWGALNNHRTSPLPPASKATIVLYFTTLRVIRKTFEDCRVVRSILRGFRVPIDERDLSMDASYLGELQSILLLLGVGGGRSCKGGKVMLPCVFIGGRLIGGAEEVRQLHESGELKRLISGAGLSPGPATAPCDACGGVRFVVCEECSGSHKIYSEKVGGFRSCVACNVNGLIRCPRCSSQYLSGNHHR